MSIEQMRKNIEQVYPGDKWSKRVSKMKDTQIIAVYNRMLNSGKLR